MGRGTVEQDPAGRGGACRIARARIPISQGCGACMRVVVFASPVARPRLATVQGWRKARGVVSSRGATPSMGGGRRGAAVMNCEQQSSTILQNCSTRQVQTADKFNHHPFLGSTKFARARPGCVESRRRRRLDFQRRLFFIGLSACSFCDQDSYFLWRALCL